MFNIFIIFLWLETTQGLTLLSVMFERPRPLAENAPEHTVVTNITVVVPDHSSLVGGPAIVNANPIEHPFVITPKGTDQWQLMTRALPKLDFETTSLYTIPILVRDDKGSLASQTIFVQIVDVNEPPVFTGLLTQPSRAPEIYITEDTLQNTGIFRVTARDPEGAPLKFSIDISQNLTVFKIDGAGTIYMTETFRSEHSEKSYSVKVTVADPEGLSATGYIKVFLVEVKHSGDVFLNCTFFSIGKGRLTPRTGDSVSMALVNITLDEEIPIGKTVGKCHAAGEDPMDPIAFVLDPSNPYFMIDKARGTLLIASRLDVEEDGFISAQSFTVVACSSTRRCAGIPVIVNVHGINDNMPFCHQYVYRYTSREVIAINTVVANVRCHDSDNPPDELHYEPSSGPVGAGKLFEQVPGAKNAIRITQYLDYEDPRNLAVGSTHEMTLSVFDDANPSHTAHHKVGQVAATDEDYPSNCVTYRIGHGGMFYPVEIFWLDPVSGVIELITEPDYESVQQYKLNIEAVDCDLFHPRTASTLVTIDIREENDEAPLCTPLTYRATVLDSTSPGTNINSFRLTCHDRDSADTSMRFEIVSGNGGNHFGFDPIRGSSSPRLIVKSPFDFEDRMDMQTQYHLVVHIVDDNLYNNSVPKAMTGTVLIDVSVVRTRTPPPTTPYFDPKKGVTILYKPVNTFHSDNWYVPFIFTLVAIMTVGLLAWSCFLIWRYGRCKEAWLKPRTKAPKEIKRYVF
ncbi:cadherin-related family member 3-like isoform X2 [Zootoca vivipara]|uniref:cadherin-related family member 3-like isoform X2 n=1 Tax=Zootoca vivipara TaxID=8524 RepID=UPI00293C117E|nr:cadherin-related family member 3-like isoform X2 [Zootoca vivipara]